MEEVMHSTGKILPLDQIDYSNELMVEEQVAIRRDKAEELTTQGSRYSGNDLLVEAGILHGEINQITRRFVAGKTITPKDVFNKRHLELKIHLALRAQGWSVGIANVRAKALADAICPVLNPDEQLDKEMVKEDLFDICVAFMNTIGNLK